MPIEDSHSEHIELDDLPPTTTPPISRRPNLPVLHLDTSNLNASPTEEDTVPQSAILGLAKTDGNGLDHWLQHESRNSSHLNTPLENRSPLSSHLSSTQTHPSSSNYATDSSVIQSANLSPIPTNYDAGDGEIHIERTFGGNQDEINPFEESLANYDSTADRAKKLSPQGLTVQKTSPQTLSPNTLSPSSPLTFTRRTYASSRSSDSSRRQTRTSRSPSSSSRRPSTSSYNSENHEVIGYYEVQPPKGRTLFYFTADHPLRQFLCKFLQSKTEYFLDILLTIVQIIVLSFETSKPTEIGNEPNNHDNPGNPGTLYVFIVLYVYFVILAIAKCIAFGVFTNQIFSFAGFQTQLLDKLKNILSSFTPIKPAKSREDSKPIVTDNIGLESPSSTNPSASYEPQDLVPDTPGFDKVFLRNSWGRIEFVSLICFWSSTIAFQTKNVNSLTFLISGVGHLRILKFLYFLPPTRVILFSLKRAMPLLANVLLFIAFFLFIWGIIGLQTFNGSLRRFCVYDGILTNQHCGSYLDPETYKKMPYLIYDVHNSSTRAQDTIKGYTCPAGSQCIEFVEQPNFQTNYLVGGVSFDNIFNSLEVVFVLMSNNMFTPIMYDVMDAEYQVSSMFFIFGVFVLGIWLMNLLVAVMVSSYSTVKETVLSSQIYEFKVREWWQKQRNHGDLEINEDSNVHIFTIGSSKNARKVLESKTLGRIYLLILPLFAMLAFADIIVQAAKTAPKDDLFGWELAVAIIFAAEILVRFALHLPHWRLFFTSFSNLFDIILSIANLIVMAFYNHEITYAWLTIFQLFRVYRVVASLTYVRNFWTIIVGNSRALINLTLFFFGTSFLCTLMACKMLRGLLPKETDGELNIFAFYDLAVSYFAMYQVASTENWTDVLFYATQNVTRQGNNILTLACIGILFSGWLFFANFLIYNLFIGLMSENLHGAISNQREEQVKQLVKDYLNKYDPEAPIFNQVIGDGDDPNLMEDLDEIRPVTLMDKIKSFINRKQLVSHNNTNQLAISYKLRTAIERKFVIEFLEKKNQSGHLLPEGKPTHIFSTDPSSKKSNGARAINDYSKHPFFLKSKSLLKRLLGIFHHFPSDYRHYLNHHLETRRKEARARSNTAYVEEMFDYNEQAIAILDEYCKTNRYFDRPLFIFGRHNPLRTFFQRVFPSSGGMRLSGVYPNKLVDFWVRLFFMVVTVALVVQTCVNTPLKSLEANGNAYHHSKWSQLHIINLIYGCVFSIEFLGKVIADGFHFTPNAYTRSLWNILDCIVLISIWITFVNDFYSGPISRYLRALMALRALRLSTIYRNSEKVFNSIFVTGFPNIMSAAIIALSILVPYSVWGKNVFHDRLLECNDENMELLSECYNEYSQTVFSNFNVLAPRVVTEMEYFNYNNFWSSLLIQFGVLSLEGWIDVLQTVTSITKKGHQPETYASKGNAVYPIMFDYIGALFIIGMFVAVIIRNYSISMGTAYLTEEQLAWRDLKRTLKVENPTPKKPRYRPDTIRYKLLNLIPAWTDSIEKWMLFISTVCMASYFYPTPIKMNKAYGIIYIICNTVLILISLFKLVIEKPRYFFHDLWNPYQLAVSASILGVSISNIVNIHEWLDGSAKNADRSLFILLLLLWIPRTKRLYQFYLIGTSAISQISKLLWAWFTLFITYAIALNQSFGLTKFGEDSTPSRNFRTVPKALIALFTMSCGEGWNEFLIDFTITEPNCIHGTPYSECGIPGFAYFLFISWNLVSMYVFANLFISLICEACWYVFRKGEISINPQDINQFKETWQMFDPKATGYIRSRDLHRLLGRSQGYFSLSIFHQDPKYSVRSILEATNADLNTTADPYDVDVNAIFRYLDHMPVERYKEKKRIYYLFTAHARLFSQQVPGGNSIAFTKLLLLFPLYKDIDPAESLTIKEFIILKVQLHEVQMRLAADYINRRWRSKIRSRTTEPTEPTDSTDPSDPTDPANDSENPFEKSIFDSDQSTDSGLVKNTQPSTQLLPPQLHIEPPPPSESETESEWVS